MSILPKAIYRFNAIPIKVPMAYFHRYRTNTSKIYMEPQMTRAGKDVEKKEPSYTVGGNAGWCSHCGKQVPQTEREPRNKPMSLWSVNIQQRGQKHKME